MARPAVAGSSPGNFRYGLGQEEEEVRGEEKRSSRDWRRRRRCEVPAADGRGKSAADG
jgi:hypothetical protein